MAKEALASLTTLPRMQWEQMNGDRRDSQWKQSYLIRSANSDRTFALIIGTIWDEMSRFDQIHVLSKDEQGWRVVASWKSNASLGFLDVTYNGIPEVVHGAAIMQ